MRTRDKLRCLVRAERGEELVEFAVSLPILVVLVVGIYDFGSAFTLKHRLNSAVEEGAKVAAGQQMTALNPPRNGGCGAPASVCVVRDVVQSTLVASNVNDCGLGASNASLGPDLTWTFTANCPAQMSLKVERGVIQTTNLPSPAFDSNPYNIQNTRLTLVYPYNWQFNRVIQLVAPRANYLGSTITVQTTMQNID